MSSRPAGEVSIRVPFTLDITEGAESVLRFPIEHGESAIVITSATGRIRNKLGSLVVERTAPAGGFVIDGAALEWVVPAADTDGQSRGDRWLVELDVEITVDGSARSLRPRFAASLVRNPLPPVITAEDLYQEYSWLRPSAEVTASVAATPQDAVDAAWRDIRDMIEERGTRWNLITKPQAFRRAHLALSLAKHFDNLAGVSGERYLERAETWHERFASAFDAIQFEYDANDDGRTADDPGKRTAQPALWLY